jgi:hypothetical protein
LLTFGDAHLSNLQSTISSHSFFQYGSGSIVRKLMEIVRNETLFCRMDYQNCSVSKTSTIQQVAHAEMSESGASKKKDVFCMQHKRTFLMTHRW